MESDLEYRQFDTSLQKQKTCTNTHSSWNLQIKPTSGF